MSTALAFGAILVASTAATEARADLRFTLSPLVAEAGTDWRAACSATLQFCEVTSRFVSLRRSSTLGAEWVVSLKAGTATAPSRIEEMQVGAACACDQVLLTVGQDLRAVEHPDLLTIVDAAKANAVLRLFVASGQDEVVLRYRSRSWDEATVKPAGLAEMLAFVDEQQSRSGSERRATAPAADSPVIPASMVADTDAFTDPERTVKELPAPVRKLFAQDLRRGCKSHSVNPNRPYFDAHWVERDRVVFFVECTRPGHGPTYRAYTATGPSYADARLVPLVQWDGVALQTGRTLPARRDVPTRPMFMPAETLVLDHRRDGIKNCRIEHTYRWLKGSYRLLTVRASECNDTAAGALPDDRLRFQAPVADG